LNRRRFLSLFVKGTAGVLLAKEVRRIFTPPEAGASFSKPVRWGFLVDTYSCIGCGFCVKACKLENEVPFEANVSRTWVERYVVTKDGRVFVDTPQEARNGFTTGRLELGEGKFQEIRNENIQKAFFVPKLCNQCENPPCVQVCPVGATYQTAEGISLVDKKWCIGCGYCIMACPYGMRFFHPVHKVADKCTFCYHRIAKGLKPACVQACPTKARKIGNLKDPKDPVAQLVLSRRVGVHKPEYGTKPQVYFLGLSEEVR
jgi:tetrathionate reductase subunit B